MNSWGGISLQVCWGKNKNIKMGANLLKHQDQVIGPHKGKGRSAGSL